MADRMGTSVPGDPIGALALLVSTTKLAAPTMACIGTSNLLVFTAQPCWPYQ